jgi:hypothetical protein
MSGPRPQFAALEGADRILRSTLTWITDAVHRVGVDTWNYAPELSQTRTRAARLVAREATRREAELARLEARGVSRERSCRYLNSRTDARRAATRGAR